jgi:hypothetical protein
VVLQRELVAIELGDEEAKEALEALEAQEAQEAQVLGGVQEMLVAVLDELGVLDRHQVLGQQIFGGLE